MSCSGMIRRVSSLVRRKTTLTSWFKSSTVVGCHFLCGEKRNADGKGPGTWGWTSLMGNDRKTLLKALSSKLEPFIRGQQNTLHNLNDSSNMKDKHCPRHHTTLV